MVSGTGTRWPSDGCNATAKKLPCAAGGSWSCDTSPKLHGEGQLGPAREFGQPWNAWWAPLKVRPRSR